MQDHFSVVSNFSLIAIISQCFLSQEIQITSEFQQLVSITKCLKLDMSSFFGSHSDFSKVVRESTGEGQKGTKSQTQRSCSGRSPKKKLQRLCLFVFPEHLGLPQSSLIIDRLIAMLLVFKLFSYINAGRKKVLWAAFKQENKSLKNLFFFYSATYTV